MFPYVAIALAGINLILAILGMALDWITVVDEISGETIGDNLWVSINVALFKAAQAFLVLTLFGAFVTVLLCSGAIAKRVSWVGVMVGNGLTAVFALVSFVCFVAFDIKFNLPGSYSAGFGCTVAVCFIAGIGACVSWLAHRNTTRNSLHNPGNMEENSPATKV
mmetsp:Transcript_22632/g.36061  ORF Transcript_22632/g.36061 Transcript_22632/m.36061 type:complete len:164 (+) Transcript_22632:461-952(+)